MKLAVATEWLTSLLMFGEVHANAVKAKAAVDGLSWATVRRAAKQLGVTKRSEHRGFGLGLDYWWRLPAEQPAPKRGRRQVRSEAGKAIGRAQERARRSRARARSRARQTKPAPPGDAVHAEVVGLPLSDLALLHPRPVVRYVIATEVACGRVREEDGRYWLVPECLPADVLAALRRLAPIEPDTVRSRLDARPSGELARSFA